MRKCDITYHLFVFIIMDVDEFERFLLHIICLAVYNMPTLLEIILFMYAICSIRFCL